MHSSPLKQRAPYETHAYTPSEADSMGEISRPIGGSMQPKLARAHTSPASLQQRHSSLKERFEYGNYARAPTRIAASINSRG